MSQRKRLDCVQMNKEELAEQAEGKVKENEFYEFGPPSVSFETESSLSKVDTELARTSARPVSVL